MRPWWIMLDGVGPGVGKSTLAAGLADSLRNDGHKVELVPEEAVFERPEFSSAAAEFRSQRFAREASVLEAYSALALADDTTLVFDWSCAGMAEDLPWAREQEALNAHVEAVTTRTGSFDPLLLFLDVPVQVALDRAVSERGDEWLDHYASLARVADGEGPASPWEDRMARAARNYRLGERAARRNFTALAWAGWRIVRVDATNGPEAVLSAALAALTSG